MSTYTFSDLSWVTREDLAPLIRKKSSGIAVVDVRDSDYIGGHIAGCLHVPTNEHDYRMPELVRTLKDKDTVVFHCALSQQRGPSSALRYLRERASMVSGGKVGERTDGRTLEEAQKVKVLDGGFSKWQQVYGEDGELTEAYVKDLWG